MNTPSSSNSSISSIRNCEVCGKHGHGNHFGAITCRACAAFFRKNNEKCGSPKNGWFSCKRCRLQKCNDIGMTITNFQFDRDSFPHKKPAFNNALLQEKIPPTMDTFLGHSNLIIFSARQSGFNIKSKYFIDLQFLLDKTKRVLEREPATPLHAPNALEKLALGLQQVCWPQNKNSKVVTKFGREEVFTLWEDKVLKVAKWLTYFDNFRSLPAELQLRIVKSAWKIFSWLERLATTAKVRRQKLCSGKTIMAYLDGEMVFCDLSKLEIDLTWCTEYTFEQLKFFDSHDPVYLMEVLIQPMIDLHPTDVELSFMLCQLCFHHIGKCHQGTTLQVMEQFQEILSNNLHDYYVNRLRRENYANRIASMMKINNMIQKFAYRDKVKSELMKVFDIFYVEYSHPDLFIFT